MSKYRKIVQIDDDISTVKEHIRSVILSSYSRYRIEANTTSYNGYNLSGSSRTITGKVSKIMLLDYLEKELASLKKKRKSLVKPWWSFKK